MPKIGALGTARRSPAGAQSACLPVETSS